MIDCSYSKIAKYFPEVIWHTETPLLRTAPTPLYLLSGLVRQNNYKVVLTGEGADEILGGYDIFKEAKIRAFINRYPESSIRPYLLKRLYPYLALSPTKSSTYSKKFFDTNASPDDYFYAHRPRWKTTGRTKIFLTDEVNECVDADLTQKMLQQFEAKLQGLDYFSRAQYLESKLLLGNYLLSSQGDRMAMANSVEGRFPFLDHRIVEFATTIPTQYRMKVLNEKNILKKCMNNLLPTSIISRKKQPYMAPDILSFFEENTPEYLDYYLSDKLLAEAGLFKPQAVKQLMAKCHKSGRQGFRENMAFVGILSTQILYEKFVKNFQIDMPKTLYNVKVIS
jgi:asparagine synthase (glutamine-hydrolysing)